MTKLKLWKVLRKMRVVLKKGACILEGSRTVRNDGSEPASVLIVSAPRASGYKAMEWN